MIPRKFLLLTGCALVLAIAPVFGQKPDASPKPGMLKGPAKAPLEKVAQIDVPAGYIFIDGKGTRKLLESKGEPTSGQEVGLLVSTNEDWSVFFQYSDDGYVKDDEKDKL